MNLKELAEYMQTRYKNGFLDRYSGFDYETNPLGSVNVNPADAIGTEYIIDLNTSRIEEWFGDVNTNYGIVLIASGRGGPHIGSSENGTAGYRPKLVVSYEFS